MKRRAIAILASLFLVSLSPGVAFAYNYADQENDIRTAPVQSSSIYAQTFTAGFYGPLMGVAVAMVTTGGVNVSVTIEDTVGTPASPKDGALATGGGNVTIPAVGWATFQLTPTPILTPGHVYAMVVFATDHAQLWGSTGNVYAAGRALVLHSLAWTPLQDVYPSGPDDLSFMTIMGSADPTATPTHVPTRAPTATPVPTVAPTDTPAPTVAPTDTPAPTDTATAVPTVTDTPATGGGAAPTPGSGTGGSGSGSGSGGMGDLVIPALVALIVALGLAGGGFAFWRLRRN